MMKENGPNKVTVVLVNWNAAESTLACIQGVRRSAPNDVNIIVIDNGSRTEDKMTLIEELGQGAILLENPENVGFACAVNRGVEEALKQGSEYVLLLNNDGTPDAGLIDALRREFDNDPNVGIGGALILSAQDRATITFSGRRFDRRIGTFRDLKTPLSGPTVVDMVEGSCMMVRAGVFRDVGLLSPAFFLYWEEVDFCMRAKLAGWQVVIVPAARFYHEVTKSASREVKAYLLSRNRFVFLWLQRKRLHSWWYALAALAFRNPIELLRMAVETHEWSLVRQGGIGILAGLAACAGGAPPLAASDVFKGNRIQTR